MKQIGDNVGQERIQVLHGTIDKMLTVPHGMTLAEELGGEKAGIKKVIFEGKGHVLMMEEKLEFDRLIKQIIEKTEDI